MEHRAIHDAGGEIRRIAAAGEKIDRIALDAPLLVEADLPVAAKVVTLAGEDEIVVAVETQLAWASRDARRKRCGHGPLRRLALLAAEAAAHAPRLAGHIGIGNAEHAGHHMLHFRGMLGRGIDMDVAILARDRQRDLAFEIEMLLPADAEPAVQLQGRLRDRRIRIAAAVSVIGQNGFTALQRVLDRDARRLGFDLHHRLLDRAARDIPIRRDDGEERLTQKADVGVDEERIVAEGRRHVVLAGDVGCGEHGHHAGHGTHGRDIERDQSPARLRRLTDGHMQRALGLADVVDILRGALDVLDAGIVRQGLADVAERLGIREGSRRCVHGPTPPPPALRAGRRCASPASRPMQFRSKP